MNEFVRLIRKGLRPFGYDVRKRHAYHLLPFKAATALAELKTVGDVFDGDLKSPQVGDDNLNNLTVFLRTCIRESRNMNAPHGVTGASLSEMIKRCLMSTIVSINEAAKQKLGAINVIVLDDHSDPHEVEGLKQLMSHLTCPWKIQTTKEVGQGPSLHEQFSIGRGINGLCYFCEDDYLHLPSAVTEMWSFYKHIHNAIHSHMVLHPQESVTLHETPYPSYLLLSPSRHWRTMSHATHVLFTHGRVVDQYWHYFEDTKHMGTPKRRIASESKTSNRLFEHMPGFCPMPALAGHLQKEETLPPFFDWRSLWDVNKVA